MHKKILRESRRISKEKKKDIARMKLEKNQAFTHLKNFNLTILDE
jgi:hypothetical protein